MGFSDKEDNQSPISMIQPTPPNLPHALDGGIPSLFHVARRWLPPLMVVVRAQMKSALTALTGILIATSAFGAEEIWQVTLRNQLRVATSNLFCRVPMFSGMRMHYTVPAAAAKTLESRTAAELLPVLSELRAGSDPVAASIIDQWTMIARQGLRGTPSVISTVSSVATQKFEVFEYSVNLRKKGH
jgi:hypothetical protein